MPFVHSIRRSEEIRPFPGGHPASYILRRSSKRRSLALRLSETGDVVVNAPLRLAQREIDGFLHKHAHWVGARLQAARERQFVWRDGAALPYLGQALCLRLLQSDAAAKLHRVGDTLIVASEPGHVAQQVTRWYQAQARILLGERLLLQAARAGLPPPPLRLSAARTRWGSLSAKGVVSLNWRLLKAPPAQIDYVICHEIAHFKERNHSSAFWREVAALFPRWREVRAELRQNGAVYFLF